MASSLNLELLFFPFLAQTMRRGRFRARRDLIGSSSSSAPFPFAFSFHSTPLRVPKHTCRHSHVGERNKTTLFRSKRFVSCFCEHVKVRACARTIVPIFPGGARGSRLGNWPTAGLGCAGHGGFVGTGALGQKSKNKYGEELEVWVEGGTTGNAKRMGRGVRGRILRTAEEGAEVQR